MNHPPALHIPVLYHDVCAQAHVQPGEVWVDCTLGRGGHCLGLLERGAQVIALDRDQQAITESQTRLSSYIDQGQLTLVHSDFRDLSDVLGRLNLDHVDGILADIGVSSPQLDEAERGFSFRKSGPLDMRMDRSQGVSAAEWIEDHDLSDIFHILRRYGEEPRARQIASLIKSWSLDGGGDTLSLAQKIEASTPMKLRRKLNKHPATKTFQALRIVVNDELGALEDLLRSAPPHLNMNGRLLIISFHSLEDRLIKHSFRALSEPPQPPRRGLPPPPGPPPAFSAQPRRGISPSREESERNPRARSARLRVLTRTRRSL
jgi:16S rRNA (cytosine1402-N4)-methyltransferase